MKKKYMKKTAILLSVMISLTNMPLTSAMASDSGAASAKRSGEEYCQEPAGYTNKDWTYKYETQDYGYEKLVGAYYKDSYYSYLYNENDMICGMADVEGNQIVKYVYDENDLVSEVFAFENGRWVSNKDEDFIGNQNRMLSGGMFFDEETDCYYVNDRYYNPVLKKYMDGTDDDEILYMEENPFSYNSEDQSSPFSAADSKAAAQAWADRCLASNSFGTAINYSSSWYSGLSNVELLTRAIYCEGGTAYKGEENAVARVILNRIHSSSFPDGAAAVVKQSGQFASITGGSGSTEYARKPATTTERWSHSTYLACLLLTTTSKSEWTSLVSTNITGQLYFYAYTKAKSEYASGSCPFTGTTSSTLKYGGNLIKDVHVVGYGNVTSFRTLFDSFSPVDYSRNIYYNYK